ncbi:hypothetical protein BASA50_011230 [Batrachochytrium salamandrivorans]|uniref:Uncharacterized protein n=1 Tax=Batrachochytrium salamandrivorans TaxID=1357716 RepID=A0ABQ8EYT4_9FUNG|nr:hypothetical protein BASA50_011230 [Batrachochytrium salamandrivorans]
MDSIEELPWMISRRIYEHAGILTKYLHNQLEQPIRENTLRMIMIDCFQQDNLPKAELMVSLYPKYNPYWETLFVISDEMISFIGETCCKDKTIPALKISSPYDPDGRGFGDLCMMVEYGDDETFPLAQRLFESTLHLMPNPFPKSDFLDPISLACYFGRIDIVKTFIDGEESLSDYITVAIKHNHVDIVELLLDAENEQGPQSYFDYAVGLGRTAIADRIYHKYPDILLYPESVATAMANGHMEVVWYLVREPTLCKSQGLSTLRRLAAAFDHQDLLDYANLHDIGGDDVVEGVSLDIITKNFDIALKLLGGVGEIEDDVVETAAYHGHVDFIGHILDHRDQIPLLRDDLFDDALGIAAGCGHYGIVRLLIERGIGVTQSGISKALISSASRGHLAIYSYLYFQVESLDDRAEAAAEATRNDYVYLVEYTANL